MVHLIFRIVKKAVVAMNLAITHALRVAVESKEKHPLSEKIERFWDLDT